MDNNKLTTQPQTQPFTSKNAANADWFASPKSRSALIKSSAMSVDGLPKQLKIFRIAGSRYWQVRIFSHGKYIMRSLKTTEVQQAKELAAQFYTNLVSVGLVDVFLPSTGRKLIFSQVANQSQLHDLIQDVLQAEREKVARHEIKAGTFTMIKGRLESFIFDFFRSKPLASIDTEMIESFVNHLSRQGLATPTIQGYLAYLKKLLRLMFRRQIIKRYPLFPSIKMQHTSRGAFTLTEYKAILRKSKELRRCTFDSWGAGRRIWIKEPYHTMPVEMNWVIRFMVYTFVRPGDIRQIKNKHIEIIKGGFRYLRLTSPEIKRHQAPTVSLPAAVGIFEQLLAYQTKRGFGKPDDYVFLPEVSNRALARDTLGWLFNWILTDLDMKQGPHGINRSLYSLRHTSITFRLIYGGNIDLLTLARNARTSVEMIDKFYASTLSAEMNIALLHGKRK